MSKTAEDPRGGVTSSSEGPQEQTAGAGGSPLRVALGVLILFMLAAWMYWDLDKSAAKDAERRGRQALVAQHQELLKAQATCSTASLHGPAVPATEAASACAEAERVQERLKALEATYRRACTSCASIERCEEEVRRLADPGASLSHSPVCH
jgi:hypothetical protein